MLTEEKLGEAKYFLDKMIKHKEKDKIFRFNLSAFLSAARSITLVLQKEFAHVNGFKEWYFKKQVDFKKDPIMKFFVKKRNITQKERLISPVMAFIFETSVDIKPKRKSRTKFFELKRGDLFFCKSKKELSQSLLISP